MSIEPSLTAQEKITQGECVCLSDLAAGEPADVGACSLQGREISRGCPPPGLQGVPPLAEKGVEQSQTSAAM